jgi:hypothetical protein
MIKSLEELSRILALAGISTSQEEQILAVVKNLSASLEAIEETDIHEPCSQDDLQTTTNSPCQAVEDIEDSCITFTGEKSLEAEIEECSTCLSKILTSIPETTYPELHA